MLRTFCVGAASAAVRRSAGQMERIYRLTKSYTPDSLSGCHLGSLTPKLRRNFGFFSSDDAKKDSKATGPLVDSDLIGYLDANKEKTKQRNEQLKVDALNSEKKKFLNENLAFNESMRKKILQEAQKEFNEYKARYTYMPVLDELVLSNFLKAVLAVQDVASIDPTNDLPAIVDHASEKVFQLKSFENVANLFAVMMRLSENSPESKYNMTSALVTWAEKVSLKELVSVLALVPPSRASGFAELFSALEEYFLQKYTKQSQELTPAEMVYILELLVVYRRADPKYYPFVEGIEDIILDKLESLPAAVVTALLKYFLEVIDIPAARREQTLEILDTQMRTRARYLGEREVLKILFLYVKHSKGSDLTINVLLSRLCGENMEAHSTLIKDSSSKKSYGGIRIDKFGSNPVGTLIPMNDGEIKLLTNLLVALKLESKEKSRLSRLLQSHITARLTKIEAGVLLECLFTVAESQILNRRKKLRPSREAELKDFFTKGLDQILKQVYLLTFSQITRLWSVNLMTFGNKVLQDKLCERLDKVDFETTNLPNLDLKDFSFLVWTLTSSEDRENLGPVFSMFEDCIQSKREVTLKEVSYVLWAVVLKFKIQHPTFDKLIRSAEDALFGLYGEETGQLQVLRQSQDESLLLSQKLAKKLTDDPALEDISSWELMNLVWGLSKFESPKSSEVIRILVPLVLAKLDSFSATETLMVLRVYAEFDYFTAVTPDNKSQESSPKKSQEILNLQREVLLKPLVEQLASIASQLDQDHIDIFMYLLLQSPLLRWSDHKVLLDTLFNLREDLKKKILSSDAAGSQSAYPSSDEES